MRMQLRNLNGKRRLISSGLGITKTLLLPTSGTGIPMLIWSSYLSFMRKCSIFRRSDFMICFPCFWIVKLCIFYYSLVFVSYRPECFACYLRLVLRQHKANTFDQVTVFPNTWIQFCFLSFWNGKLVRMAFYFSNLANLLFTDSRRLSGFAKKGMRWQTRWKGSLSRRSVRNS